MKVRTAFLEGPKKVKLVERDLQLKDDEILIKTHLAMLCDSDKAFYRLLPEYVPTLKNILGPQAFLGHEGGGAIVEVGKKVHEYKVGDKVFFIHDPATGQMGTLGDYFTARPIDVYPAPEGLDMDIMSAGEPFAVALFGALRAGVKLGDTVVVSGVDFYGQVLAQAVKKMGVYKLIIVDKVKEKLAMAKKLGADVIINANEVDAKKAILDANNGQPVDVFIQAAGYWNPHVAEYTNLGTEVLKISGILSMLGDFSYKTYNFSPHYWHHHGLDVRVTALRHHSQHEQYIWLKDIVKIVQLGLVQIKPLFTKEFPLKDVDKAYEEFDKNDAQIKITVRP